MRWAVNHKGRLARGAALAIGLTLAACSTSSSPFSSASDTDVTFLNASQTWDLDKDGNTTCDEWKKYSSDLLRQADGDGDGALNGQEWSGMSKSDRLFDIADLAYYDANGDGKVTIDELTGKQNAAFRMLDKNGDCKIAHDEKATVYNVAKPKVTTDPRHDPSSGEQR